MPSAWELDLGTARFTLTLSPEHYRGFTGEGALLGLLADPGAAADADMVSVLLAWDPRIDTGRLAARAGFSAERVIAALTYLAARGRVGYDLAELIQLLTQLMEDASDALAVERAAAGG